MWLLDGSRLTKRSTVPIATASPIGANQTCSPRAVSRISITSVSTERRIGRGGDGSVKPMGRWRPKDGGSAPSAGGVCSRAASSPASRPPRGFDARYIVSSLEVDARQLYEDIYCAHGQAENLIKLHKTQLASDRASCQSPVANQVRLVLHIAAWWLMLALRDAVRRPPAP